MAISFLFLNLSSHVGRQPVNISARTLILMGLSSGNYVYYDDLQRLSSFSIPEALTHPTGILPAPSPVNIHRLSLLLVSYPDQRLASYILCGFREGFRIGVSGTIIVKSHTHNHPSCQESPGAISAYISSERAAGRMTGPLPQTPIIHVSPIGLVPKGHQRDVSYLFILVIDDC